jgi:hypothetical protein
MKPHPVGEVSVFVSRFLGGEFSRNEPLSVGTIEFIRKHPAASPGSNVKPMFAHSTDPPGWLQLKSDHGGGCQLLLQGRESAKNVKRRLGVLSYSRTRAEGIRSTSGAIRANSSRGRIFLLGRRVADKSSSPRGIKREGPPGRRFFSRIIGPDGGPLTRTCPSGTTTLPLQ